MEPIIQVNQLAKSFKVYRDQKGYFGALINLFDRKYDLIKAVDKISFKIYPGELVGYIGPNGAGKSTTIKMLTGLLVPTAGELTVNGYIPWKERKDYVKDIGAVFGQRTTLWWDLPLTDSFDLLKRIYEIPDETFSKNYNLFREILALDEFMKIPVRGLSLGQRMRATSALPSCTIPAWSFWMSQRSVWMWWRSSGSVNLLHISTRKNTRPSC